MHSPCDEARALQVERGRVQRSGRDLFVALRFQILVYEYLGFLLYGE